jgi:hypothetical protein
MSKHEMFMTLGCLAFEAIFLVGGTIYGIGGVHSPGAGFLPFWVSLILITLSGAYLIIERKELGKKGEKFFAQRRNMNRLGLTFLALLAYTFLLSPLGFIPATFLFMFFLLRFVAPQTWKVVISFSVLTALAAYAFFVLWLGASLPPGILQTFLPL